MFRRLCWLPISRVPLGPLGKFLRAIAGVLGYVSSNAETLAYTGRSYRRQHRPQFHVPYGTSVESRMLVASNVNLLAMVDEPIRL